MQEFESFVYLDVQKTGSTFISKMLYEFSRERRLRSLQHEPLGADYDPSKFHFISVRDPAESYLSLYSFGCGRKGKVRAIFRRLGLDDYYDGSAQGYAAWLAFVLKPGNAEALRDGFDTAGDGRLAQLIGPQSYRYLRLAVPDSKTLLDGCASVEEIRAVHDARKVAAFVVRHERFVGDLTTLIGGKLRHAIADPDAALAHVRTAKPANASQRVDEKDDFAVPEKLLRRMRRREWLLCEAFGY